MTQRWLQFGCAVLTTVLLLSPGLVAAAEPAAGGDPPAGAASTPTPGGATTPTPGGAVAPSGSLLLDKPAALNDTIFDEGIELAFPRLWNIMVAIAAVVFMLLLLFGGFMYLAGATGSVATKDTKAVSGAKELLLNAVIGLILVVIAWPVGIFILNIFGLADKTFNLGDRKPNTPTLSVGEGAGDLTAGEGSGTLSTEKSSGTLSTDKSSGTLDTGTGSGSISTPGGTAGVGAGESAGAVTLVPLTVKLTTGESGVTVKLIPVDFGGISTGPGAGNIDTGSTGGGITTDVITGTTGSDGGITVEVPAKKTLEIEVKGKRVGSTVAEPDRPNIVTVDPGGTLVGVQITITDNKKLVGVPGYKFRVYLSSTVIAQATTDSKGQATVQLPAGKNVNITSDFSSATLYNDTVPSDNGRNWTVFVSQAAGAGQSLALHYRFLSPGGGFASGKSVQILDIGESDGTSDDTVLKQVTTPQDGLVTVTGLKPGTRLMVKYNNTLGCGVTVPDQNATQAACTLYDK